MTLNAGTRLGAYEIVAAIGAGGMGEVYRARDTKLGRDVAIKVLPVHLATDPAALARFEREARAVAALSHPNILAIHDFGSDGGVTYAVTELLEGETLRERLADGALPVRKAVDYAVQMVHGIAAAHEKGIIHRDLKPENIFITKDGHVKVLDFGLAKAVGADRGAAGETRAPSGTTPGTVLGTVGYMSPEQVRGLAVDHRTDIFSFGSVLYEMLTGRRAFAGASHVETMNAILKEDPAEVSASGAAVPGALDRILRRCLEKRPDERFHSAHDLGLALETLSGSSVQSGASPAASPAARSRALARVLAAAAVLVAIGVAAFVAGRRMAPPPVAAEAPAYQRLTFRSGHVVAAQFTPDAKTIVYMAHFDGSDGPKMFTTRPESPESAPLPFEKANRVAISRTGELAVIQNTRNIRNFALVGTLARGSLMSGAARAVLEDVQDADWLPDGSGFAVSHYVGGRYQLEFPIGHVVYQTGGYVSDTRVSPDGTRVAFTDHPVLGDDRGVVAIVDRAGAMKTLTGEYSSLQGLEWSPGGDEIWFTGARHGNARDLEAVTPGGRVRTVATVPGSLRLGDIAPDGRVLLWSEDNRLKVNGRAPGETEERDLTWLDWSRLQAMSRDGRFVLIAEMGEGGGSDYAVYLRKTDGSPPVRLGSGDAMALSPDGRWALAQRISPAPAQLVLLPTGAGEPRMLTNDAITHLIGAFSPDGTHVVFGGFEPGRKPRTYIQDLAGGPPKAITPEGAMGRLLSPDGSVVLATRQFYPVDGSAPRPIAGLEPRDVILGFGLDARTLYAARPTETDGRELFRLDAITGRRALQYTLIKKPGWESFGAILITPDASAYAYVYSVNQGSLYLATGLR